MRGASDALTVLRAAEPTLPPALARIAGVVHERPESVAPMSSIELARRAGTSAAAVSRLCARLGFASFSEFKTAIAVSAAERERARPVSLSRIDPGSTPRQVLDVVSTGHRDALAVTADALDLDAAVLAVRAIQDSELVIVFAVAASGPVAADLALKLVTAGVATVATSDRHVAAPLIARHGDRAAVIVISYTGRTRESLAVADDALASGAGVIALTSDAGSRLGRTATQVLVTLAVEDDLRSGGTASRIAQLLVVDVLVLLLRNDARERELAAMTRMRDAVADRQIP